MNYTEQDFLPQTTFHFDNMDRPIVRAGLLQHRHRKWIAAALLLVLVAGLAFMFTPSSKTLIVDRDTLTVAQVVRAPFLDYLPLRAEAQPAQLVVIPSLTGGQIVDIRVSDGEHVAAGQPLAVLANPELRQAVTDREVDIAAQLAGITAQRLSVQRNLMDIAGQLSEAENARLKAHQELAKQTKLYEKKIVNDAYMENYRQEAGFRAEQARQLTRGVAREHAISDQQLRQIRQTEALLQGSLADSRSRLNDLTLRAPVTGLLAGFGLQIGQTIAPGNAVGQIDPAREYKLVAEVDEYYLSRVRENRRGKAAVGGRSYPVIIKKILRQVVDGRFRVELAFAGGIPADIRTGQAFDVQIMLGNPGTALVVPAGPWADAGGMAFVSRGDGSRFERRQIAIGRRTPTQIEVISGLSAGDTLITSSLAEYRQVRTIQAR